MKRKTAIILLWAFAASCLLPYIFTAAVIWMLLRDAGAPVWAASMAICGLIGLVLLGTMLIERRTEDDSFGHEGPEDLGF